MKRIVCLVLALLALSLPAMAAQCASRIDSDGNRCRECALGNFGADALRAFTGADLALFAAGDLGITLPAGEITAEAVADSFPNDEPIVVLELSTEELAALLEESLSRITLAADESIDDEASAHDGYFSVSGFTYSCDVSAPVGSRVYDLPLEPGTYTLAISARYADSTGNARSAGSIREAVTAYCDSLGTVEPPDTDRVTVLGAWENKIVGDIIPRGFVLLVAGFVLVFSALSGVRYRRRLHTER